MADIETTVAGVPALLVDNALTLAAAANGVVYDTGASISGAVAGLNFAGKAILRLTATNDLTGSFTWPPTNIPPLAADNQSVTLTVAIFQDATGNRDVQPETLFANAGEENIFGIPIVDESPGGVTTVDIVARRAGGTTTYTVLLAPTLDASQLVTGTLPAAVLPTATGIDPGIVVLAGGSGAAAAGNHTHTLPLPAKFTIEANGATIPTGDYNLLDMPAAGAVIRMTGVLLEGAGTPTATVTAKISGTSVTGTGTAANATTASTDKDATGANTFVARQLLQVNVTVTAGTVTMVTGYIHYALTTNAWAG